MKLFSALALLASLTLGSALASAKDHWVCNHNGSEVKVKGKNPKAKQADCESKGGIWEKKGHDKQSSGGAGSW